MIQPQELRIGNYYKLDKSVSIDENVLRLELYDIRANKNISKLINPIPLTEEWLKKFGFKEEWFGYAIEDVFDMAVMSGFMTDRFYLTTSFGEYRLRQIKYVHQLQNLFFALVGEELTLKTNQ